MSEEIIAAVKERIRLADSWARSTGYKAQDYFDCMMDLRRMMAQYEAAEQRIRELERVDEAKEKVIGAAQDLCEAAEPTLEMISELRRRGKNLAKSQEAAKHE